MGVDGRGLSGHQGLPRIQPLSSLCFSYDVLRHLLCPDLQVPHFILELNEGQVSVVFRMSCLTLAPLRCDTDTEF